MEREQAIRLMQDLLRRMVEKKGSDLFITAGFPPAIKVDGEIRPQSDRSLSPEQSAGMVRAIMNDRQTKEFDATKECNFAIAPPGIGRFRVSAFVQQGYTGAVVRTINAKIPTLEELELRRLEIRATRRGVVATRAENVHDRVGVVDASLALHIGLVLELNLVGFDLTLSLPHDDMASEQVRVGLGVVVPAVGVDGHLAAAYDVFLTFRLL